MSTSYTVRWSQPEAKQSEVLEVRFAKFLDAAHFAMDLSREISEQPVHVVNEFGDLLFETTGEDFRFFPQRQGQQFREDGSFWIRHWVFADPQVAEVFRCSTLQGYSQGAGRAFANRPTIRVGKYRTLVVQTGGKDI